MSGVVLDSLSLCKNACLSISLFAAFYVHFSVQSILTCEEINLFEVNLNLIPETINPNYTRARRYFDNMKTHILI